MSTRINHPAFGQASKATIVAESLTRYQVSIGETILGFLDATGAAWRASVGIRPEIAARQASTATSLVPCACLPIPESPPGAGWRTPIRESHRTIMHATTLTLPPLKAEAAAQTPTARIDMRAELAADRPVTLRT